MSRILKVLGGVVGLVVVLALGIYVWATFASERLLAGPVETHAVDFPIPFPLPEEEVAALGIDDASAEALALERAVERGRHLVSARYVCSECHGADFGGGVMIDDPAMGRLLGPNLTMGEGSVTRDFTPADWDRIVRHGVRKDGGLSPMPSEDFQLMSDQELSDIVAFLRSQPPVDNEVPPVRLGPLGRVLIAAGKLPVSAMLIADHTGAHRPLPPVAEVSPEFGRHLAGVCTGCHGADFSGGPIPGGDPSWVPARNLTPDPTGLADWDYDDFVRALQGGMRPDGTPLMEPMTFMTPYAQSMTDTELEAIWTYLRSIPPVAR